MCLLGPDGSGNIEQIEDVRSFANSCDKSFCTCTSHSDFVRVANGRLSVGYKRVEFLEDISIDENANKIIPTAE